MMLLLTLTLAQLQLLSFSMHWASILANILKRAADFRTSYEFMLHSIKIKQVRRQDEKSSEASKKEKRTKKKQTEGLNYAAGQF